MNYYALLRTLLFLLPPEVSHALSLRALRTLVAAGVWREFKPTSMPVNLMGLSFPNRLGLAAGLDKNGDYLLGLAALGFGFVELGTVTPRAQAGNPKPRMFRLSRAHALINRLGFNNKGIDYLIEQLNTLSRPSALIGINIGKNADTTPEDTLQDYVIGLEKAYAWADYITVNISSPNTRQLRDLQYGSQLTELLETLKNHQQTLAERTGVYKPLLVKVAPDLTETELKWFAEQIRYWQLDGVIATNTTTSRPSISGMARANETGGLSGEPLNTLATHTLKILRQELGAGFPLIGVGGIMNTEDARARFSAGADLIQIYTGLIYRGPRLVKDILQL